MVNTSEEDDGIYFISTPGCRSNWVWRQEYESSFITVTAAENLPQAVYTNPGNKHILDIHYPHKCHKCKTPLYWVELYNANATQTFTRYNLEYIGRKHIWDFETYKRLKKLWRSEVIQFFCCDCYRRFGEKKR